jgi:hypothetical protein
VKNTYRACSRSLRLKLMAIIRQVRFSMRSWLGNWDLVLVYSFQIWVARGSFLCISSAESGGAPSCQSGKTDSRNSPPSVMPSWSEKSSVSTLLRRAAAVGEVHSRRGWYGLSRRTPGGYAMQIRRTLGMVGKGVTWETISEDGDSF